MEDKRIAAQKRAAEYNRKMIGQLYRHFKGDFYRVLFVAVHSETAELLVIYCKPEDTTKVWARPLAMFLSPVDTKKYPDAKQKMRFACPYYYSLYEYNDSNADGTRRSNIKMSFVWAGLMFGIYMVLAALLTWVRFSPVLNVMKAILITVIAISSLSTYLYCEYLVFGKKIGFALDVFTVASWQILIPLGVMGIWQLMSTIRIYVVLVAVVISIAVNLTSDKKEAAQ